MKIPGGIDLSELEIETLINPDVEQIATIGDLAEDAFLRFGHYRGFISSLVSEQGVVTAILIDRSKNNKIVGFLLLGFIPGLEGYTADILAVALHKDYRGYKLGRNLLDWCFDILNKVSKHKTLKELRLTVAQDNVMAVKLFTRYGFTFDISSNLGKYPSGVEATYMKIQLT
jgi:ribosomal protein S18 acetylase RimI-like enzyme